MTPERRPQRTCVGCRRVADQADLIRIAASPDGRLVPDPVRKLPGRGAYLCGRRECVERAVKRGALARTFKRSVEAVSAEELVARIRRNLETRILSFLGVLRKAGRLAVGRETIRKALQRGQVRLLITAADGREATSMEQAAVPVRRALLREELGRAVGKGPQPVIAVLDERAGRELIRWIDWKDRLDAGGGEEAYGESASP